MAKRKNHRVVASTELQGEGSFIIVSPMTYGEERDMLLNPLEGEERLARNEKHVVAHVHNWNWVDDDGNPLPLPADDPSVLKRLSRDEWNFVISAINGDPNVLGASPSS